jgi:phosphate transport system substrate-binding protein
MATRLLIATLVLAGALQAQALPEYKPGLKATGTIRIWGHGATGHDYIESLVLRWEEGFHKYQPGVAFENKLAGTASAIGALYTGTGDLALLGREIWPGEIAAFREVLKYPPLEVEVVTGSYDVRNKDFPLIVYVHRDNPLRQLSLSQVDAIFGAEHRRSTSNIRTWGELGLSGKWADHPIHVYGFEISRGFGYYFQQAVFEGSFKWNPDLVEFADQKLPDGSLVDAGKRVLDALAKDPYGIAYSAALYENPLVKPIKLSRQDGGPYIVPTRETVQSRAYPLTRVISMFLNRTPGQAVDPKLLEFLRYVLSREGQAAVAQDGGYLPLTEAVMQEQRKKLE